MYYYNIRQVTCMVANCIATCYRPVQIDVLAKQILSCEWAINDSMTDYYNKGAPSMINYYTHAIAT